MADIIGKVINKLYNSKMNSVRLLKISIFLAAAAAIAYEVLGAGTLVNLLGASVYYFSLTIGIFLAALGIGGWLSAKIKNNLFGKLIILESAVAFLGGSLNALIFGGYVFIFEIFRGFKFNSVFNFLLGLGSFELIFGIFALMLIFIVGVLVGFELPLFSRIFAEKDSLNDALGKVFFWDYAGSLAISVVLPIILLPIFGFIKTSFFVGGLNIVAAVLLILIMKKEKIAVAPVLWLTLTIVFIFNLIGFLKSNDIEMFLEKKQYGNREIIYNHQSPYQRLTFVKDQLSGKVSLYLSGGRQFESGQWDENYHQSFVQPAMSLPPLKEEILILGGGDGLALREILKYPAVKKITLVDIDPAIVQAAKELDFMKKLNNESFLDSRVNVIAEDAFKFLEENRGKKYDAIFIDFPDPTDDSLARLYSKEFYLMLANVMKFNSTAVVQSANYLGLVQQIIMKTAQSAGLYALPYHSFYYDVIDQNFGFTLLSKREAVKSDFIGFSEAMFGNVPVVESDGAELKINTLFRPIIHKAYGDVFVSHYIESLPQEKFFSQFNISPETIRKQFLDLFYKENKLK